MPINARCRYTFAKPRFVLEARDCTDVKSLVECGDSAAALSLDTFLDVVRELESEVDREEITLVCGLFSIAGWDERCRVHIAGDKASPTFAHPDISICLVGPQIGDVHANPTDIRMQAYLPYYSGETVSEVAARCRPQMMEALLADDRLQVLRYAEQNAVAREAAVMAARDLERDTEDVELVEVKDLGPVLKWRH